MADNKKTAAQQIATLEAKIARLKQKDRALENGQKIILGGMLLASARSNPETAKWLIKEAEIHVTRKVDLDRLQPLLAELKTKAEQPAS